jgi:hypothetical protein
MGFPITPRPMNPIDLGRGSLGEDMMSYAIKQLSDAKPEVVGARGQGLDSSASGSQSRLEQFGNYCTT